MGTSINFIAIKKGQDENHLAPELMDNQSSTEVIQTISLINRPVKSKSGKGGKRKSLHHASTLSISTPQAGFEPAFHSSVENFLIQLEDRGDFSFNYYTKIFDNITNYNNRVKQFIKEVGHMRDPRLKTFVFWAGLLSAGIFLGGTVNAIAQTTSNTTAQVSKPLARPASMTPRPPHARPAPRALKLFYKGHIYSAPNAASSPGYVEVTDKKTGQKLWGKVIYTAQPAAGSGSTGVFISSMEVQHGQLTVFNQNRVRYYVDMTGGNVISTKQPSANATTPAANVKK